MNNFDFDNGPGGAEGPWISWSARGTQDNQIPRESFYLRDGETKTALDAFKAGVVLDIDNMRTGWQQSDGTIGVAPEWKWNPEINHFSPQPGDDYKKGFEIRVAIGDGKAATWQQAGVASWNAFTSLVPQLQAHPAGQLPLVRIVDVKQVTFKRGSTSEPVLKVVKWVPRPDCLQADAFATEPQVQPTALQQAAPASVPADAIF